MAGDSPIQTPPVPTPSSYQAQPPFTPVSTSSYNQGFSFSDWTNHGISSQQDTPTLTPVSTQPSSYNQSFSFSDRTNHNISSHRGKPTITRVYTPSSSNSERFPIPGQTYRQLYNVNQQAQQQPAPSSYFQIETVINNGNSTKTPPINNSYPTNHRSAVEVTHSENHVQNSDNDGKLVCLIVSVALALFASFVAYQCLFHGFNMYDMAYTTFEVCSGATVVYLGLASVCVASVNAVYGGYNAFLRDERVDYTMKDATKQIALSLLVPPASLPLAVLVGIDIAFANGKTMKIIAAIRA